MNPLIIAARVAFFLPAAVLYLGKAWEWFSYSFGYVVEEPHISSLVVAVAFLTTAFTMCNFAFGMRP